MSKFSTFSKKLAFWLTFPINCLVLILFETLNILSEYVVESLHKWEGFCFNYAEKWEYLGDGIWKGKQK